MDLRIAICDDEQKQAEYLDKLVSSWSAENNHTCAIDCFPSAEAFLFDYSEEKAVDILLLDIEMGKMNGVELAKKIRQTDDRVRIVFITGFPDFIAEGYDVSALHYLMKPVSPEKLQAVLSKAIADLAKSEKRMCVSFDRQTECIPISQIIYIEAQKQYVLIHTDDNIYKMKSTLSDTELRLDKYFIKCQRSFIVNLRHVTRIKNDCVVLKNSIEVPISRGMSEKIGKEIIRLF